MVGGGAVHDYGSAPAVTACTLLYLFFLKKSSPLGGSSSLRGNFVYLSHGPRNSSSCIIFHLYVGSRDWILLGQDFYWSMKNLLLVAVALLCGFLASPALAQEVHQELQETVPAKVLEVVDQYERDILGTGASTTVQNLRIEILGGEKTGEVVSLENDMIMLEEGQHFYVNRLVAIDGIEYYIFKDVERRQGLLYLAILMTAVVLIFSGWQGARALISLVVSILAIIFLLVPALLAGYDPVWVSFVIAAVILAGTLFFTHGFHTRVVIAYLGTMAAVGVTCVLAWLSVSGLHLTGFSADASVYLNFSTGGQLDLAGLLLGSIIIGLLGVLDDVSITQSSVVQELKAANPTFGAKELYKRALRVGRDHVGSLVNTLALAYVGASLPLILLYARSDATFLEAINQEVVAAELARIMIGSIGLVLAVPLTTAIAAYYFRQRSVEAPPAVACAHGHHHHH